MPYYIVRNLLEDGTIHHWSGDAEDLDHAEGLAGAETQGIQQIVETLEAYELPL